MKRAIDAAPKIFYVHNDFGKNKSFLEEKKTTTTNEQTEGVKLRQYLFVAIQNVCFNYSTNFNMSNGK